MAETRGLPRIIGEFAVIVVGVFVALAADSWYQSWSEGRGLEEYLDRLIVDLESDSATYQRVLQILEDKDVYLEQVAKVALRLEAPDSAFFTALSVSWRMGFNTPGSQTATFDDLIATGNLRLIRDQSLRASLVDYYRSTDNLARRIEQRHTEYPQAVYRLDPSGWRARPFEEAYPALAQAAVDSAQTSGFINLLNAERTLATFQRSEVNTLWAEAMSVLAEVRSAKESV